MVTTTKIDPFGTPIVCAGEYEAHVDGQGGFVMLLSTQGNGNIEFSLPDGLADGLAVLCEIARRTDSADGDTIQAMLDQTAGAIAQFPVGQWGLHIVYLIAALDARSETSAAFRGVLDTVLDAVLSRNYQGRW
uniref:Uncharacterized protein n=2 Tax=viral metagenome TaxID=1070528 RepID=A0A6M3Y410_9ZZZZ